MLWKPLDDLEVAGRACARALRPQRAARRRRDHRRRPDPGQRAHDPARWRGRCPGGRGRPPGPSQGRGPRRALACVRSPSGSASCSIRPVRFVAASSGPVPKPPSPRWPPATCLCWRTCGSIRARPARTTAERAGARRAVRRALRAVRQRRFRGRPPQAGQRLRHRRPAAPRCVARLVPTEVEVLHRLTVDPDAAVRRGARRCPRSATSLPSSRI